MELGSRDAPLVVCQEGRAHGCTTVARTFSPPRDPGGLCLREGARLDQGPRSNLFQPELLAGSAGKNGREMGNRMRGSEVPA